MPSNCSSDSESSSRNRWTNLKKRKKRKKPWPSPQTVIDNTWKYFSSPRYQQALSILPLNQTATPSAINDQRNKLLSDGRLSAVTECQRKVNEIRTECKRMNMRYRDRDWDLAFDFADQGHCLNGLRDTTFVLSETIRDDIEANVPGAVRRVHEIFPQPTFMRNVDGRDVKQGNLSNCWFVAGLTALANIKDGLSQTCAAYDTEIGVYGFVFYRDGMWTYTIIDDTLYLQSPCWDSPSLQRALLQQTDRIDAESEYKATYQTGSKALFFAQCKDQNETWVPLLEKAYAKAHGDYAALTGGWIGEGLEDLSGGVTTELFIADVLDHDVFWNDELTKVNQEFLFGASTGFLDGGYGERDGIAEGHAYIVVAAHTLKSGQRLLKLRNPWAHVRKGIWEGAWSDGSKEWTAEIQQELGHRFGSDSVFWISFEDFMRKYSHLDRTRLFRDADWRCSQSWISIDVPWMPRYHDQFYVVLSKESPLVVVVSQLDKRYFNGLHGQYSFRLVFRMYHEDGSGVRRCVVQSQGNYLMKRSASVELPKLAPGVYIISVRVDAERDTSLDSVEDVIKQECRARTENFKLAQVGLAYEVAHKNAEAYIGEVSRLDKKKDRERASKCRQEERRRQWEERHTKRVVQRKQKEKNYKKKITPRGTCEAETGGSHDESTTQMGAEALEKNPKSYEGHLKSGTPSKKNVERCIFRDTIDSQSHVESNKAIGSGQGQLGKCYVETNKLVHKETSSKKTQFPMSSRGDECLHLSSLCDEAGYSSDSPIDEWEDLYGNDTAHSLHMELSDVPWRKTRCDHDVGENSVRDSTDSDDSDENRAPTPWSAVCIVGIRVYSQDDGLTLRTTLDS